MVLTIAAPALGRSAQEVSATGVLRECDGGIYAEMGENVNHAITDEASGTPHYLKSSTIPGELERYTGQRVTVYGTAVCGHYPPLVDVNRVEPASGGSPAQTGTIRGVLTEVKEGSVVVDEYPSDIPCEGRGAEAILTLSDDTEVFLWQVGETAPAPVADLREGQSVEATYAVPEGPRPEICPPTYEAISIVIFAASGDPTPPVPCPDDDQYGNGNLPAPDPEGDDSGGSGGPGGVGVLPDTGGALPASGVGALLICGGLLARVILR